MPLPVCIAQSGQNFKLEMNHGLTRGGSKRMAGKLAESAAGFDAGGRFLLQPRGEMRH
jgi:hypothetical protein